MSRSAWRRSIGKPFTQQSCYRLADDHLKREALSRLLPGQDIEEDLPPDQFVLVIDEINRANVWITSNLARDCQAGSHGDLYICTLQDTALKCSSTHLHQII
jgi:hypothetical protein